MIHPYDGVSPDIHPSAFVHPDATVIGKAKIGARSSIWPTTVLRADMGAILIGDDTSIQDGTICHLTESWSETVVGNKVTVGHRVILHGCVIEDECLIGMGAILLDNVRVGTGSLIGAGALVTVGTQIPPNSLVLGSPARVLRPVKDKERAMIDGGWPTYVEATAKYKELLKL
jgi:carbonic anhydrase/acetyltransferase-like protein (isoleucine patch superfamily)